MSACIWSSTSVGPQRRQTLEHVPVARHRLGQAIARTTGRGRRAAPQGPAEFGHVGAHALRTRLGSVVVATRKGDLEFLCGHRPSAVEGQEAQCLDDLVARRRVHPWLHLFGTDDVDPDPRRRRRVLGEWRRGPTFGRLRRLLLDGRRGIRPALVCGWIVLPM